MFTFEYRLVSLLHVRNCLNVLSQHVCSSRPNSFVKSFQRNVNKCCPERLQTLEPVFSGRRLLSFANVGKMGSSFCLTTSYINGCKKTGQGPGLVFPAPLPLYSRKSALSNGQGIHENISALQMKKRPLRRKLTVDDGDVIKPGFWSVSAYSTAEEYDLEKLALGLREQNLYEVCPWESRAESIQSGIPDVVHARALYQVGSETREIFFFREGSVILWNVPDLEAENVLQFVRPYEDNSYDARLMAQESESMKYTYAPPGKKSQLDARQSCLVVEEGADSDLAKYTFSNAMALSVKLGVCEASLDRYVDSIEFVTEDLKQGTKIRMSRDEVLRKTGQLFALRHLINLSSDLLDTPDFYWDRDELEALYLQTCNYFSIARRTKVMNEKLNHCVELVDLLSDHLNDRHHVRLEWMIIILIMVEVGFEILHYAHRWSE